MLNFAAIVPHPPLLIPAIGKEHITELDHTIDAIKKLEQELYATFPDVLVVISPHSSISPDTFIVNSGSIENINEYKGNFEEFGEFSTQVSYKTDPHLVTNIVSELEKEFSIKQINTEFIDHGVTVPLYYLTEHLKDVPIVVIGYSLLDNETHVRFGQALRKVIDNYKKHVAVIASADLTHDIPKLGSKFDEKVISLLEKNKFNELTQINQDLVENSHSCGYRSLLILDGVLKNTNYTFKKLSYEAPFGVGYLVGHVEIPY